MSQFSFSNIYDYSINANNNKNQINQEVNTNNYKYDTYSYEINTNSNNNYQTNNYMDNNLNQLDNNNYQINQEINDNLYEANENNFQTNNIISSENNNFVEYGEYDNNNYQISNNNNINNYQNYSYNQIINNPEQPMYSPQTIEIQDINEFQNLEQTNLINNDLTGNQIITNNENNILNNNEYNQPYENNYNYENNENINIIYNNEDIKEIQNDNNYNEIKDENIPFIDMNNNYSIEQYSEIFKKILGNKNIENKQLEDIIIKIIEKTDNNQRQEIRSDFYRRFNGNLILTLKKELIGNFKEAVLGSFLLPSEYDTYCLNSAFKNNNPKKELILSEIMGSRSTSELLTIKRLYSGNYRKLLRKDIISETSGDFQKFLLSLLQCKRSTSSSLNTNSCANDASDLYRAGEKRRPNDEDTFIRIFTTSSPMELTVINHFYKQQTGKGLLGAIKTEFEFGKETKALLDTIIRVLIDKEGFYAKAIKDALNDGNDWKLIETVCSRHSVDLKEIKKAYKRDYQKELTEDLKNKINEDNWGKIIYSLVEKA